MWVVLAAVGIGCQVDAQRTDPTSSLVLIVGDVTSTSARIFYDRLPRLEDDDRAQSKRRMDVRVYASATPARDARGDANPLVYALEQEFAVDIVAEGRPGVVLLHDLTPNRLYSVSLHVVVHNDDSKGARDRSKEEIAKFRTPLAAPSSEGAADAWLTEDRVLVVSCDRYVDDKDDTLWLRIADDIEAHPHSHFGMAHLGDQVYVDAGSASIPIVPVSNEVMKNQPVQLRKRYEGIVDQFRALYRQTFGRPAIQRALRVGAHWMIPDDHEVSNNFNYERVQKVLATDPESAASIENESEQQRLYGLALHYRAGLQTLYEYQYQLQRDFPFDTVDFLHEPLDVIVAQFPLHFAVEVHKLKLFFMDLRFDRSFFKREEELPHLIGGAQMKTLEQQLERWSRERESAAVVLSCVPLFFHSTFSAAVTYMIEKETYPGLKAQLPGLEALFQLFLHYSQPTANSTLRLLVGGDVHFLVHSQVCGYDNANASRSCFDQLITSGVTKGSTVISDFKLVPFYFLITRLTPWLRKLIAWTGVPSSGMFPWEIEYESMFLGRNYG